MAKRKQSKKKDPYVEEMSVWLDQHRTRLKSCEIAITQCTEEISNCRKLRQLEQAQARIIKRRITKGEKSLADYLAKEKKKSK